MAFERIYTPKAIAEATGLTVYQSKALIDQSPDRICLSRDPNGKKPRYGITERAFQKVLEEQKARRLEAERPAPAAPKAKPKGKTQIALGLTADGKIMTHRQMTAAGLLKEVKK